MLSPRRLCRARNRIWRGARCLQIACGSQSIWNTYDATQGTKNVKLVSVTDPRGNTTQLDYFTAPEDPKDKWKLKTISDREGHATGLAYTDPDGSAGSQVQCTVTNAAGNASTFLVDGYGRPTEVTNASGETTTMRWDADNNVVALTEANGAVTEWRYDPKTGYPTSMRTPEAVAAGDPPTTFDYATSLGGFVANLSTKTSPEGHQWDFGYDSRGNLTSVTDPMGTASAANGDYTTRYAYDEYGRLVSATDANGNRTRYSEFHPSGYPETTTDALGNVSHATYDALGHVTAVTDPLGAKTTVAYDVFGRPLETTTPKDADAGEFITTPAPVYDANDISRFPSRAGGPAYAARPVPSSPRWLVSWHGRCHRYRPESSSSAGRIH